MRHRTTLILALVVVFVLVVLAVVGLRFKSFQADHAYASGNVWDDFVRTRSVCRALPVGATEDQIREQLGAPHVLFFADQPFPDRLDGFVVPPWANHGRVLVYVRGPNYVYIDLRPDSTLYRLYFGGS